MVDLSLSRDGDYWCVFCQLSSNKHRVKIFELEAEDEDNDEEDELMNGNAEEIDVDEMLTNGNGHVVSTDDGIQMDDASTTATANGGATKAASSSSNGGGNVVTSPTFSKQTSVETTASATANGNGASISSLPPVAITQAILQKFNKQQQSSANLSTCSITTQMSSNTTATRTATPSVCSSTGATVGTSFTLENSMSSSQFMRAKRKKNFNDYDEDDEDDDTDVNYVDDNVSDNHTINDSLDTPMTGVGSSSNPINTDNTEIISQQQIDSNLQ